MRKLLTCSLLALPAFAFASAPDLVVNGSFEGNVLANGTYAIYGGSQVPGWTALDEIEVRNNNQGKAQSGSNYVELDANHNSSMAQTLHTNVGTDYTLSFYYSNRANTNSVTDGLSFNLGAGAMLVPALASNTTADNIWSFFSTTFTALSTDTVLTIAALGNNDSYGSSIDNVSVTAAVPEPETYALMLAGLGAVAFMTKRRRARI